ncbi:ABC transporter ATP-binding protein [Candidatus Nanosynsacchari sp. TM7_ANC_38.39_G1_1]|uniref:ABC transporter ATP-binding protein n=1 Tax=Candidatus Nanosynsacchari sp. TM7_ANC_38.39_G1_1 TaxID=1986206 RepID=UPI00101BC932|nr:ABC transporter ATP-binding protein [Candidatus Nanosynsacchari sp. TM7_ANC_38.39_G1_1]RYC73132.1 putative ABC transporter ATP-binding protein YknY [Candidatus Nanosynsacchari sp. TM7_ANC_38.39_G1_1]
MIEVKHITKIYGKKKNAFTALDDVSLNIEEGSSVAILGKSGSGKSTLMHAISGLDKPQKGKVLIDGEDILRLKPRATDKFRAQKMSFIFQSFFVEGGESCYDNVSLALETAGVARIGRKKRIIEALEAVDLGDKIKSRAKDLSGGQKQRLAIARAIVGRPQILFADEPTGNLDSATSKVIEDLLFNYCKENNATLIIVTHDEDLAQKCQRVIHIKDGKIESDSIAKKSAAKNKSTSKLTEEEK